MRVECIDCEWKEMELLNKEEYKNDTQRFYFCNSCGSGILITFTLKELMRGME